MKILQSHWHSCGFLRRVLIKDLGEEVLRVSPNTATGSMKCYGVLAQGRLSIAPGNTESPAQPEADYRAHVDAGAEPEQGRVQPFLTRAEASGEESCYSGGEGATLIS